MRLILGKIFGGIDMGDVQQRYVSLEKKTMDSVYTVCIRDDTADIGDLETRAKRLLHEM